MLISKFKTENMEERVSDFEKKYAVDLPKTYRDFIKKYNGGRTPDTTFKGKIKTDITGFFGFDTEEQWNIENLMVCEIGEDMLQEGFLPIAENSWGDYFGICINGGDRGSIFFWQHDMPGKGVKIADDFTEFISKSKSEKIGHIRTIEERKRDMIAVNKGSKITDIKIKMWQQEIDYYAGISQEEVIL